MGGIKFLFGILIFLPFGDARNLIFGILQEAQQVLRLEA